jgi:ribokinase
VHFVGAVGSDHWGEAARADLAGRGIDVTALATVDGPTGVAIILVDDGGENSIAVIPGANAAVSPVAVEAALASVDADDAVLVVCLEIPLESVVVAAVAARARGWRVVLNPAPAQTLPPELVAAATVITPNATEVDALGGVSALLAAGAGAVVVTRGADGTELFATAAEAVRIAPSRADVVDTTGAGDAFTAALAVGLADGRTLPDAVAWASAAGAIATEGFGARGSLATATQVDERLA